MKEMRMFFLISIITISGWLFNSTIMVAEGNVLHTKNYSVSLNETLFIKISSADIEVVGWNNSEVDIVVEGDDDVNDYLDFTFSYEDGTIKIITEKKREWSIGWWSKEFKIKVKVPTQFNLDLKTSGGDIEVKKIEGDILLVTSGGNIEIDKSEGSLDAKTSGGDIEIEEFMGNIILKTSGGDIDVKDVVGNVEAKTSGGDMELIVKNGEIMAGTSGGDIDLAYEGNNEGVELYTSGGDISVKLPSDFSADVYLKASGGNIKNNFSSKKITELSKTKFEGKYNNGGAEFRAKTSGGSILVNEK